MPSDTALIFSSIDDCENNWCFGSGEFDPGVDMLSSEEDEEDEEEYEDEKNGVYGSNNFKEKSCY